MDKFESVGQLEWARNKILADADPGKTVVHVCMTGCQAYGAAAVKAALDDEVRKNGLSKTVEIRSTGCHGFCAKAPVIAVSPLGIQYQEVDPEDAAEIVDVTLKKKRFIDRLAYQDAKIQQPIFHIDQIPFYRKQEKRVLAKCGRIDPTQIEHYIAGGGYQALARALSKMAPDQIIETVTNAKLRGRGGAGFPTGLKWKFTRAAQSRPKYIVCNADEGDPGAFMDRAVLEGNPHSVIEGMVIGAYGIGNCHEGAIYVRNEYPMAVENAGLALQAARDLGLLGDDIAGSGFSFDIHIRRGGGAFVCGESSALMQSLQGNVGEPQAKYVRSVERGLWDRPTTLNNVETWANVPLIIAKGWDWYAGIGTEGSKGTKIFSLVGKVNNTGLVEVPMGMTIREIVYDIGGGIENDRKFKAVQTGGPSGGCIPESLIDIQVDYESLTKAGCIMGSGGMIVADERTCMVDISRFFMDFIQDESCGKCVPCRIGTKRMLEILIDICEGRGTVEDLQTLEDLAYSIKDTALCALGQTAPNPVLTTLKYFKDEYLAHIEEGTCPAKVCKALIRYRIIPEACTGCGACLKVCPTHAISGEKKEVHFIHQEKCIKCGACYDVCNLDAVIIK